MPRRAGTAGGLALAATLLSGSVAEAASFTVTNTSDSGSGSLADAITQANTYGASHGGAESTILFQSGLTGSIDLTSDLPQITEHVYIKGPGADKLTINGEHAHGIFDIDVTDVSDQSLPYATAIQGLTLTGGKQASGYGGAVWGRSSVSLNDVTITNSSAKYGGAVLVTNPDGLWLFNSTISGDTATFGGGIYSGGNMYMENSTISGNTATAGGGIDQGQGAAVIVDSTIAGNHASYGTNCGSECTGGGLNFSQIPTVRSELHDTIVAGNTGTVGPDVFVPKGLAVASKLPAATFSLIGNPSASRVTTDATDITGQDPQLGPLANNGGPTQTMLPADTSPAIDAGSANGLTTDQRGMPRPVDLPGYPNAAGGDGADIGAVEVQPAEVLPIIRGLSARAAAPGSKLVIIGTHLGSAAAVMFGSIDAPFRVDSDTRITAVVPLSTGTVDVRVVTRGGQTAVTAADRFRYLPAPPRIITAAFDGLRFKITAPPRAACVAPTSRLPVAFSSSKVTGAKWSFSSAAFFIDRRRAPAQTLTADGSVNLAVTGLKPGDHTLRVVTTAARRSRRHTTTIPVTFVVC